MMDSNSENEFEKTSETYFKYRNLKSETEMLKKEHEALMLDYQRLEKENAHNHSQIQSLKLALDYHNSYQITKEIDSKQRIKELELTVERLQIEKQENSEKFVNGIKSKDNYIEYLLTTMLNLHQKVEYYKDDLTLLRKNYESQENSLKTETKTREETERLYEKALQELESFKKSLTVITNEYKETKKTSENIVGELKTNFEYEHKEETTKIMKNFEGTLKDLTDRYNFKLKTQEKTHQELMKSMNVYLQNRISNVKQFYEDRISNMIRDYSFQEAKFYSQTSNLSYLYENLQRQYKEIEEELLGKSSSIDIINKERKIILKEKLEMDKYIEKIEIEHKRVLANTFAELETMKSQIDIKEKEMKNELDSKILQISNRKQLTVEGIRLRYQKKLEKILKNSEEDIEKQKKFHQSQCEILLEELAELEIKNTNLSIQLECDVKELKDESERKSAMYEKLLLNSREDLIKKYEKEKKNDETEHKLQIHELTKKFQQENEKALNETEKKYREIIENVKKRTDKEKYDLVTENLKKVGDVQEICNKRVIHVEAQLTAVRQNLANEISVFQETLQKKGKEMEKIKNECYELEDLLNKEKVKNEQLVIDCKKIKADFEESLEIKNKYFLQKEEEIHRKLELEKKNFVSKLGSEKVEVEKKLEKTISVLNERYDALYLRYKLLESKKREQYMRENQQTLQRLVQELTEKNKSIDSLNKEIGRLKIQIKYADSTMKIFAHEKNNSTSHKKTASDALSAVYHNTKRPSSVGLNKTFKF